MIDTRLLTDDFEATARRLSRKGVSRSSLEEARDLVSRRLRELHEVDDARRASNAGSADVGRLMREGKREEAEALRAHLAAGKADLEGKETALRATEDLLEDALSRLPNLPDDAVPDGTSEADNVVVRTHGYDPADYTGRRWRPHWEVAADLGIFDVERATKLSGPMFSVLRGDGARLLRGLVNFALDLHRDRYEETVVPHLVQTEVITKTGHLTKFDTQAYRLRDDELWLLPTAEVALMGLAQGEILDEADLPKRAMAYSVCWRREAGAAGKDTRGMQRLHEFHKVELVTLTTPEASEHELGVLLADCERSLQVLGLPYRVLELCAGDLTFSSSRVYDLEVYAPGVDKWLEVSSVSLITDFQARRGTTRYRKEGGDRAFVHSLNGSGLATPRVWAALIEHGQQPDGSVRLPPVLVPYVGTEVITGG
jgi:seryl-tRNA synthetase